MKTLEQKISEAAAWAVRDGKKLEGDEATQFVRDALATLGIFGEEDHDLIYECKEGYAREVFVTQCGLPLARYQKVWSVLSESSLDVPEAKAQVRGTAVQDAAGLSALADALKGNRDVTQWADRELLEAYDSEDSLTVVEEELLRRSKNRRFLVYNTDKESLDVDTSLRILKKARKQDMPRYFKESADSKRLTLYKVGEAPNLKVELCPVSGKALIDNYSESLGHVWEMGMDGRQFVKLMVDQNIRVDILTARQLEQIYADGGLEALKDTYTKVAGIYEDLKDTGELPKLIQRVENRNRAVDGQGRVYDDTLTDPLKPTHKRR